MESVGDYDFDLPEALIAQSPSQERTASRLLVVSKNQDYQEDRFAALSHFLQAGDCLIFNDTRVIKARLFGKKASGGKVEILVERVLNGGDAVVQLKVSHRPILGSTIYLPQAREAVVQAYHTNGFVTLHLVSNAVTNGWYDYLEYAGTLPLPPYIKRTPGVHDEERYQTVYARQHGAVAAPTAGLHFDNVLLDSLKQQGISLGFITLHVGAGTFQPIRADNLADHHMHREHYHIPVDTALLIKNTQAQGRRVIAVGTTTIRALEAQAQLSADGSCPAGEGATEIFIRPGFQFRVCDGLITNFHLPRSSLLVLVSAFGGYQNIRNAYAYAIAKKFRFFSYGDAMLLQRAA